jgi:hypothetical protein
MYIKAITVPDIIHLPVFYLKRNVSEVDSMSVFKSETFNFK